MDAVWTGCGRGVNGLWTGCGRAVDAVWTGCGRGGSVFSLNPIRSGLFQTVNDPGCKSPPPP